MSNDENKIEHSQFGDMLIDDLKIIFYNNSFYVYEDGYYKKDKNTINSKMIKLSPSISTNKRNEVLNYLRIKTYIDDETIQSDPYIINLKNTRFNIKTGEELEFTSEAIEFQKLPIIYNPKAKSSELDKVLNKVFNKDQDLIKLFYEMIGYCLIKHCNYDKAFIFYGNGSNGKSTILELIENLFGSKNYSTIELDKLTQRFHNAELENKYINIGDDINSKCIKDVGTIKNIFSGNAIQVERKGEKPFTLKPYAKHIFACNEIPKVLDQSNGIYRRLVFIPFTATISKEDSDFDPLISEKLREDIVLSALLNGAIEGVQRLIKNNGFTEPRVSKKLLEEYMNYNSSVLSWIADNGLEELDFIDKKTQACYSEYKDWCVNSGIRDIVPIRTFNDEVRKKFNLNTPQKRETNSSKKIQVFKGRE